MLRPVATTLLALCSAATCVAQEDFDAFRQTIEKRLRAHAFFSKVSMTLIEHPPFLFCIERPAADDKDYEKGVGRMVSGDVLLHVNSSTLVKILRIAVRGTPAPSDPQAFRDRYVAAMLGELWVP